MRDWEEYVRGHLALPDLTPGREERIVRELAGQLDEFFRDALARGLDEREAVAHACRQVPDWSDLAAQVREAERPNTRPYLERLSLRAERAVQTKGSRRTAVMHALNDVRYAVRRLRKNPGFTIVAALTLAIGIGANTAIFSALDSVLLRPAPIPGIARVAMVWETDRNSGTTREPASVPDYLDFLRMGKSFDTLAAFAGTEVNMAVPGGDPVRLAALSVSHEFLPLMGMKPVVGRTFYEAEDRVGGPGVVLISESLWTRYFGRDPAVAGRVLRLDEKPRTVIGVMPDTADFGILQILASAAYSRSFADRSARARVDVWEPLQPDPRTLPRDTHPIFLLGRLATAATVETARQEMSAIADELERAFRSNAGRGVFIERLEDVIFGPLRPPFFALLGAVALVLVAACINVAGLQLARGINREPEIAVRCALGARPGVLARQFLVEGLILTLLAAGVGVALAFAGIKALGALAPPDVPRLSSATIDVHVLALTAAVSVLVGLVFGMVPTLQAWRLDLQSALRGAGGSATSAPRRNRLRAVLVVAELALAVLLTVGAGLLLKSFWLLSRVDPGFRAAGVLKAEYQLPPGRYPVDFEVWPNFKEIHAFTNALLQRAQALPGVESAAIAGNHPLDPGFTNSFAVVGREAEAKTWPEISIRRATAGYFRTVGPPLVRGRLLLDSDTTAAPPVLLVNEAAAERFFPGRDPMGQQIAFWGARRTIVGIVANERFQGLAAAAPLAAYLPLAQAPSTNGAGVLLLRTGSDPLALVPSVRAAFRELDPALAVFGVEPLEDTVSKSVTQRRFVTLLLTLFAVLTLLLAVIGIQSILNYETRQRTREIGIRIALGAGREQILRRVVGRGFMLAGLGILIGSAGALGLARVLTALLFGIAPTDAGTFVAVATFIAALALAASYFPARRATRIDPTQALRSE